MFVVPKVSILCFGVVGCLQMFAPFKNWHPLSLGAPFVAGFGILFIPPPPMGFIRHSGSGWFVITSCVQGGHLPYAPTAVTGVLSR